MKPVIAESSMMPSMPRLSTPARSENISPSVAKSERRGDADDRGEEADLQDLVEDVAHAGSPRRGGCR